MTAQHEPSILLAQAQVGMCQEVWDLISDGFDRTSEGSNPFIAVLDLHFQSTSQVVGCGLSSWINGWVSV